MYKTAIANSPTLLSSEPVELLAEDHVHAGSADLVLEWLPKPRVLLRTKFASALPFLQRELNGQARLDTLRLPTRGVEIEAQARGSTVSLGPNAGATILFSPSGFCVDDAVPAVTSVQFHVANLPAFWGRETAHPGRMRNWVELTAANWRVRIEPAQHAESLVDSLKAGGGYGITHYGQVETIDGSEISRRAVRELLNALGHFLTFVRGQKTPPLLARGLSTEGAIVWEELQVPYIDPWNVEHNWFDSHEAESLERVFPGFWDRWNQVTWRRPLEAVVYWYSHSNVGAGGADGSLVLAQAALELLAWTALVKDRGTLSEHGFERLPASDKIRLLLSLSSIPLAVPTELTALLASARANNWIDGPHALTSLRNSIVHPDVERRDRFQDAVFETWQLAQWYIELSLLRLFNFTDRYGYRLKSRWRGETVPVPWTLP